MTTNPTQNKSDYKVLLPGDVKLEMVKVEGSTFMMGGNNYDDEKPIHEVKVPNFLIILIIPKHLLILIQEPVLKTPADAVSTIYQFPAAVLKVLV